MRTMASAHRETPPYSAQRVHQKIRNLGVRSSNLCARGDWQGHLGHAAAEEYAEFAHQNQEPADQGICERFHKTVLNESYRVAFRKKVYRSIDELQADLHSWIAEYMRRGHIRGASRFGKIPMQTFLDATPIEGENDRSPTTSDTKTLPFNLAPAVRSSSS